MSGLLLGDKNAVIYGGGGAIGGAIARVFAREGARVFIAGRTQSKLDVVARDIAAAGASTTACGRIQTTRMLSGASSAARTREKASLPAALTLCPRMPPTASLEPGSDNVRMTPGRS